MTKKYKEFLGFTSKTTFLSKGREAICPEVLQYLSGFDILVHQTYGQIEACTGIVSANVPKRFCKMGTSGKAIPGIKTKVDKSDDVLTPMVDGEPGHVRQKPVNEQFADLYAQRGMNYSAICGRKK